MARLRKYYRHLSIHFEDRCQVAGTEFYRLHACTDHNQRKRNDPKRIGVAECKASYDHCHSFAVCSKSRIEWR